MEPTSTLDDDPLWYKRAVIYEIHVRAFCDSNGDGIGDFVGLIQKLDYLRDLGVTALWLLPFYPSPLRDGGYDIADYTAINPSYGTLAEFKQFLDEAHARGLRVITELVLNHTSVDHAWFQRARRAPAGSSHRDFYVWSDSPAKYQDARIIFKDFETSNWSFDPVADAYYWHRFYAHQPDLNFDNPEVGDTMLGMVDFWFELGVDGLRLDAVPYLYERQGTNCENLPETHAFLRRLRSHVDGHYKNRMLLAEANQWPEDAVAYFGANDECHMNFHFPLMPRMFMAVHLEDRFPIVDILRQTPAIPESCQWATFLRNHDELTLEMVTDEDRDYMYRVYAEDPNARINLGIRRRLGPLVKSRSKVELMNGLLFSLPGTPVLYYGDEIGMGDNIYLGDRDGVRTPMQWSADRNAGFSSANPQRLYLPVTTDPEYHYEVFNVQANESNPSSLLWWMKRIIDIRKQNPVFGAGTIDFLQPENHKILAFVRTLGQTKVLIVANLSRYPQFAELDLSSSVGLTPVEMFGQTRFPPIGTAPYLFTLAPHAFYWFMLEPRQDQKDNAPPKLAAEWAQVFDRKNRSAVEAAFERYVAMQRWFRSKARVRAATRIVDVIDLPSDSGRYKIVLVSFAFTSGEPETYVVPVGFAQGDEAKTLGAAVIAELSGEEGVMYDALATGGAAKSLMQMVSSEIGLTGKRGRVGIERLEGFPLLDGPLEPKLGSFEQTNSSIVFSDRVLLKIYRRLESGTNPELEMGTYLASHAVNLRVPKLVAALGYSGESKATLATVQEFVPNEGGAWQLTLDAVERFFDRVVTTATASTPNRPTGSFTERARSHPSDGMQTLLGEYLTQARKLGARVAALHVSLIDQSGDPAFAPEAFTGFYQRSLFQSAHASWMRASELLHRQLAALPAPTKALAVAALGLDLDARFRLLTQHRMVAGRIRVHGDLHLGQILHTGDDFIIIDFEGEPAVPINERRYKRNPLRDVAGMLRSFQYAVETVLRLPRFERARNLRGWADAWNDWVSAAFLDVYLGAMNRGGILPEADADKDLLLGFHMLDKCVYEIDYELNNRPDWLDIPLRGLLDLMGSSGGQNQPI